MTKKPPKDRDEGLRRFLTDFRSHHERRSFDERRAAERRSGESTVDAERRRPEDRRDSDDRREMLLDRRRCTSELFIREQIEWIRRALLNSETSVACPRCEGDLLLGPTSQRGGINGIDTFITKNKHIVITYPSNLSCLCNVV